MGNKIFWISVLIALLLGLILNFDFKTLTFNPFWVSMLYIAVFVVALFVLMKTWSKK